MKVWIIVAIVLGGLGVWLYTGLQQTYGLYGIAKRVSCRSNIGQIAKAALIYTENNDGRLMPSEKWMDTLLAAKNGLQEQSLHCPCGPVQDRAEGYGYAYNSDLSGKKVASFALPEHTPLFFESKKRSRNVADPLSSFSGPFDPAVEGSQRANVAYLSGKTEWIVKEGK